MKARKKELGCIEAEKVWTLVDRKLAQKRGAKVLGVRWIDVNKGDLHHPNFRSRLVVKEFNTGHDDGLFAATPPLEAFRWILSEAATMRRDGEENVILIRDVARAFFEADATREIFIELPEEPQSEAENAGKVAMLRKSMYGTRDAAKNFQREVKRFMVKLGFNPGRYNVCTYWHEAKDLKVMIHGDDFATVGERRRCNG